MAKSVDELAELAWGIIEDALIEGRISVGLNSKNPRELELSSDQIIDLAAKMAQVKMKKPTNINAPEDFQLQQTTADDEE